MTVTNDALSVVRIALQRGREWHLLATPHVHSRRFPLPSLLLPVPSIKPSCQWERNHPQPFFEAATFERGRDRRRNRTRPVYKWASGWGGVSVSRLSRNVVLGLGRGRANFLRFLANRFSPGADPLFALLLPGNEGVEGRISPMGYTGFFVSINSLHPDVGCSARRLREWSIALLGCL